MRWSFRPAETVVIVASEWEAILAYVAPVAAWLLMLGGLIYGKRTDRPPGFLARVLDVVTARPAAAIAGAAALSFAINLTFAATVRWPFPAVQDEFSYLLASDTYARFRATNPTPDLAESFDTHYVLFEPTYQSKYPPGQGLALAVGEVLTGEPAVGLFLSTAAAAAATCWLAWAWLTPRWALAATLAFVCNDNLMMWWGQTFWGGSAAYVGGALLFGATRRIVGGDHPTRIVDGVWAGAGLVVLANTRPFEGLVASVLPTLTLAGWAVKEAVRGRAGGAAKVAAACLVIGGVGAGAMAGYHTAVVGSWWRSPYFEHVAQRSGRDPLSTLRTLTLGRLLPAVKAERGEDRPKPKSSILPMNPDDPRVEERVRAQRKFNAEARRTDDYVRRKVTRQFAFYVDAMLYGVLACGALALGRPWAWLGVGSVAAVVTAICLNQTAGFPHYVAPIGPLFPVLTFAGAAAVGDRAAWWARFVRLYAGLTACLLPVGFVAALAEIWPSPPEFGYRDMMRTRVEAAAALEDSPGPDLVFVRYGRGHSWDLEWVYNGGDLDGEAIVWARDLGPERNAAVIARYGEGRTVWLAAVANREAKLVDYAMFRRAVAEVEAAERAAAASDHGGDAAVSPE